MKASKTQQRRLESDDFIRRLTIMKVEAGRLGFWRTMHKLDLAVKEVGYEFADIRSGKQVNTARRG